MEPQQKQLRRAKWRSSEPLLSGAGRQRCPAWCSASSTPLCGTGGGSEFRHFPAEVRAVLPLGLVRATAS
eukprot:2196200-Alexandrium_andersonii.AAC.1